MSGRSPSTGEPGLETVEFQPFTEPTVLPDVLADRYRLDELVGRGGMAEVYRAEDVKLARKVAVKLLLDSAGDETDRARFITEAKTLAVLSHPNLVTVLDAGFGVSHQHPEVAAGPESDRPFLVMELVDGPTWGQLMKRGPMTLGDLAPIAAQVADALAYVHARGIVHRDVKPGNVLIGSDDVVKLADFGIARLIAQRTHHTRSGVTLGTAAYIAPEQVSGGPVDGAADVYALGLVLLEAITGQRAYTGTPAEAALARLHRAPEIPPMDPVWHDLLTRMTALTPGDRPTAAEVVAILQNPVTGVPVTRTRTMTGAASVAPAAGVSAPTHDPTDDTVVRPAAPRTRRLGGLSTEMWGVVAAFGALAVLMIALALAGGGDSAPDIPDNTPADLREPLTDLHVAVNGDGG
jgi:serine/threonine protein kinase